LPGSKSLTHRALICAALAGGESLLRGALVAEDTQLTAKALESLGARISFEEDGARVQGTGGKLSLPGKPIYLGNSGTSMRLLTAIATLCSGGGEVVLDGNEAMRRRPISALVDSLRQLGVEIEAGPNGCPPVRIKAQRLPGGRCVIDASQSSQFVSALLLAAPYAEKDTAIQIAGEAVSTPYIALTVQMMARFGVAVQEGGGEYSVRSGQRYQARGLDIEPDGSNASYFLAAAAATGGRVKVVGLGSGSAQGDMGFLDVLEEMGCEVVREEGSVEVKGPKDGLRAVDADMARMPDVVPTLAVLAALAKGETRITGAAHLRHKECDRLSALATELSRVGVKVSEQQDGLTITGGNGHGAEIETYDDHRIAMSFAVLGLAVPGISVKDPGCVAKSFPGFWEAFERLYG
jgi:3-phosphoshikimate 1-carboxyvinyltransferase